MCNSTESVGDGIRCHCLVHRRIFLRVSVLFPWQLSADLWWPPWTEGVGVVIWLKSVDDCINYFPHGNLLNREGHFSVDQMAFKGSIWEHEYMELFHRHFFSKLKELCRELCHRVELCRALNWPSMELDQSVPALPPSGLRRRLATTVNPWRALISPTTNPVLNLRNSVCVGHQWEKHF